MRTPRCLGIVLAIVLLLTACGTSSVRSAVRDKPSVLTIAIGVDPDTLDPMRQTTTTVQNIVQMMVESLARVDQDGKVQPGLATGWQEAPDGMSWTFTLRSGIRFSDGTPFDAGAVKASIDRALDPKNTCPLCLAMPKSVKSVDVVDPGHVRFTMNIPLAADVFLGLLSQAVFGILSPRSIDKDKPAYAQQEQPVGTGPYVLKERVKGDHVTLRRNEDYWGRRPSFAEQVLQVVPDAATREALARSGQAQVILMPPASDLPSLQKDPTVRTVLAPGDRVVFFAINTVDKQQPLLQRQDVRQALNYAINRDAIVKSTLFGAAEPMTAPMAPSLFGYCPMPNPYRYDPDLARSMLQKAGASGLTVSLLAPTGRYIQDFQAAQNVANDLRAIGVNVQGPRTMDWPSYLGTVNVAPSRASVDIHMLGWAPPFLDASQAMAMFDPAQQPPRGLATAYYDNANVTSLIAKAQVEVNRDARAQEYCDAEKQVWNEAPWIFLWVQKFPIVHSAQVTGIGSMPSESFYTVYAQPA
ncbi:MAG TPA: ABC transporter substrate-binding protein [Candidatus Eisenbacteria bacterium]|nr:ABC transporter substrate-binding protein [Candidatus Eisenbacteria bacterium]